MRTPRDAKHNDYNRVNNINMCSYFFGFKNCSSIGTSSNSHILALGTAAGIKKNYGDTFVAVIIWLAVFCKYSYISTHLYIYIYYIYEFKRGYTPSERFIIIFF